MPTPADTVNGFRLDTALALRPREAAAALGISERLLWTLTNRGEIPHFKLNKAVLYSIDALREWMKAQIAASTPKAS